MLSLWCRTAGSRASNVGAALGDERCQGVTCHRYDRAVYLTAKEASPKQASPVTVILTQRRVAGTSSSPFQSVP